MVDVLTGAGLISIAVGAWSGFVLLVAVDKPDLLRKVGIVDPARVRQVHLDWVIMGVLMVTVSLAVPDLSEWAASAVLLGGIVNPLTFIPMAFSRTVASTFVFQAVSMASFVSLSTGLTAAAASWFLG